MATARAWRTRMRATCMVTVQVALLACGDVLVEPDAELGLPSPRVRDAGRDDASSASDAAGASEGPSFPRVGSDWSVPLRDGFADAAVRAQILGTRCTESGGEVAALSSCCEGDFPDSCRSEPCPCSSPRAPRVSECLCSGASECFTERYGCVLKPLCQVGRDLTCNDDPRSITMHGRCTVDETCSCLPGHQKNPESGRCR